MEGWTVVMCGWGRPEAGVLCVVWMAGLVEMEVEPPPQSESSMFPPLLQPAPQPFCNLQGDALQSQKDQSLHWKHQLKKKTKKHTHTDPSCWWAMCRYCVGWPGRPIPTGAGRDPRRTRWWAGTRILGNRWADRRRSWSCSSGLVWRSECSLALGYGYAGKPAPAVGRPTAHAHILGSPTGTKLGKKKIIFHILKRPESTVLRYFFKINCTRFNTQPPRGTRPLRSPLKY